MNDAIVTPLYTPLPAQSGLVMLDIHHGTSQAVKALDEATHAYENRLEWHKWTGPKERMCLHDNTYTILFQDKTFLGAKPLANKLILFPAAFALSNGEMPLPNIAATLSPYLNPKNWRWAIHHPTHHQSAIQALKNNKAFLPFWGQVNLFPKNLEKELECLVWAMGHQMKTTLTLPDSFSLTLLGVVAGQSELEGPSLLLSLPGTQQSKHWRHWMSTIVGAWLHNELGRDWRLHCIHQFPQGRQGLLAQATFPSRPHSAHALIKATTFINQFPKP